MDDSHQRDVEMTGSVEFMALIPLAWCVVSWLLSRISGWSRLADAYPAPDSVDGEVARMRTGKVGPVTYHSCLRFQINDQGLRVSVAFPLRLGHAPLFISWDQFHRIAEDSLMYSRKVRVSVGHPTIAHLILPSWVRYRMPLEMRPVDAAMRL